MGGGDGEVRVDRGSFQVTLKGRIFANKWAQEDKVNVESQYMKAEKELLADAKIRLIKSTNHLANFLDCIRSRQKPVASEIAGASTAICCHLMGIAYRTGQAFQWDPAKRVLVGNTISPAELTREYRSGYTL